MSSSLAAAPIVTLLVTDSNYLSRCALAIESAEISAASIVLALDDEVKALSDTFPEIGIVKEFELLQVVDGLRDALAGRSRPEKIFTMGPSALLRNRARVQEDGWLVYLDSDIFFMQSLESYLASFQGFNVILAPHRHYLWNRGRLARYGNYNVGLVAFRNNEQGLRALRYWAESCLEWCYDRAENGKYADQKYLEHFSSLAEGVFVDNSLGANLAPWNSFLKRVSTDDDGQIYVNGDRLVYFHAQGLKLKRGRWILGHLNYLSFAGPKLKRLVYRPYLDRIESWSRKPGFEAFGTSRVPTTWIGRLSASLMYFLSFITGQTMKRRHKVMERPHDPPK